jgi:uncharacterized membrane protein YeaQ/YmgE (transglycosylase-associated protein family)
VPPSTSPVRFPPPLLREWPVPVRLVLAVVLPATFGFLCGALLGSSGAVFLALQVIGIVGGFAAGFEHDHWRGGVLRGLCGGAIFGGFILIGHAVAGGSDHGLLPEVQAFQILITVFFGVLLGWLGSRLRARSTRRQAGP